jgi:hypothetical protein
MPSAKCDVQRDWYEYDYFNVEKLHDHALVDTAEYQVMRSRTCYILLYIEHGHKSVSSKVMKLLKGSLLVGSAD